MSTIVCQDRNPSRIPWRESHIQWSRHGRHSRIKIQAVARVAIFIVSFELRNYFRGGKFTFHWVGYPEESDMRMSNMRGFTVVTHRLLRTRKRCKHRCFLNAVVRGNRSQTCRLFYVCKIVIAAVNPLGAIVIILPWNTKQKLNIDSQFLCQESVESRIGNQNWPIPNWYYTKGFEPDQNNEHDIITLTYQTQRAC